MKQKNIVLMVVAVGCGLVAAALTQYSRAKPVEQVEVIVAAKDLSVGTVFSAAEMNTLVKRKSVPKDGLPPVYVTNFDELLDKRLSRPMRAEEALNPGDLNKGMALPDGRDLVSLPIGAGSAASGFVPPGSRIDITASLRLGNTTKVFKLLCNTLIVNANQDTTNSQKTGAYADLNQVGLALTEKEALVLELAKSRNCTLTIKLRNDKKNPEDDKDYDIEKVIKLLEDKEHPTELVGPTNSEDKPKPAPKTEIKPEPAPTPVPDVKPEPVKTVKVWYALRDIAPGTEVTADLMKEAFEVGELEEKKAGTALTDLTDTTGKVFVLGVAQGHWVTKSMIGKATPKAPPRDEFTPPNPTPVDPKPIVEPKVEQPKPTPPKPVKPEIVDVPVTGPSGTVIHRYEKFPNGKMRKVAELTPEQASAADRPATDEPKAPEGRKAD